MTQANAALSRTVTLRAPDGRPLLRVKALPAALGAVAAVALAPRLTALASLGALLRQLSITLDG